MISDLYFDMECIIGDVLVGPINGSLHNNPGLVDGKIGRALYTDGVSQYVNFGSHRDKCIANLDLCPQGLTVMLWLKIGDAGHSYEFYISNGGQAAQSHGMCLRKINGHLESRFRKPNGHLWQVFCPLPPDYDAWHHVAVAWKSNIGLKLYVDGVLKNEKRSPHGNSANNIFTDFVLGNANNLAVSYFGQAWYDELRIYYDYKVPSFIMSVITQTDI